MWDVGGVGCSGCRMLGMWNVRDVGCSEWGIFGMRCMGYLAGYGMLIYKMPPGGFDFAFDTVRSLDARKRTFK